MSEKRQGLFAGRPTIYICMVIVAVLAAYFYRFRADTIFSCQADGYSADRYIAYCNGLHYGDYEHGAFHFGLEPSAESFAKNADVLFLGNSRLQVAFSTNATTSWFSAASIPYYLLGFSYDANAVFLEDVLAKVSPRPKVLIINVDNFFDRSESPPVKAIFHDPGAQSRYETKRLWQLVHEPVCKTIPAFCGKQAVIFRSRETGIYERRFPNQATTAVTYDWRVNPDVVSTSTAAAAKFLSSQSVGQKCMILTMVPTVDAKVGNASAIAKGVGLDLVIPEIRGELLTYDGSHLDKRSAERWSEAFFQAAGSNIRSCLEKQSVASP